MIHIYLTEDTCIHLAADLSCLIWSYCISLAATNSSMLQQPGMLLQMLTLQMLTHVADAGQEVCTLLHVATFGSVIACLLRHFRASLASLPLLSQPVGNLPIGTWAPTSRQAQQEEGTMPEVCHAACRPVLCIVTAHLHDHSRRQIKEVYKCCV